MAAVVALLVVWTLFIHNPGFRKHERHESIHLEDRGSNRESNEEHPTLKNNAANDVLPLKDELHVPNDGKKSLNVINIKPKENGRNVHIPAMDYAEYWDMWNHWPSSSSVLPEGKYGSQNMSDLLLAMGTARIESFNVGIKGTQLKVSVILEGGQMGLFKPKRYSADHTIKGDPISGFDRHDGEIAAFHLDGILGFNRAPPVVGRVVDLFALLPVTSPALKETYFMNGTNRCFYGVCYYCKPSEAVCADGDILEGSLTIWLPQNMKLRMWAHPFRRTYRKGVQAVWEKSNEYCKKEVLTRALYNSGPRLLDIIDTSIFDFLIDNADRHHYETFAEDGDNGRLLHLDNGKGFRNPFRDELSILAPLRQCCRLRQRTWDRLQFFNKGGKKLSQELVNSLKKDPLSPVLHQSQVQALDKRLTIVISAVEECFRIFGQQSVLQ